MKRLLAGLAAGMAGTAAEAVWTALTPRFLGREPVFAPAAMAARLLHRLGTGDAARFAAPAGVVMRAVYGPSWGIAAVILVRGRRPAAVDVAALATTIWLVELVMLPASGATPPVGEWPPGEIALDAANAAVYSAVTVGVLRRLLL